MQEGVERRGMLLNNILLLIIGFSGGAMVATGLFALITMLGIINRYAQDTNTANHIVWYEECVIWGASVGSIIYIYNVHIPAGTSGLIIFGIFGGIYAGCLSVALAETIKAIPVMINRINISKGLGTIVLLFALGKGIGSLIYFYFLNYIGG